MSAVNLTSSTLPTAAPPAAASVTAASDKVTAQAVKVIAHINQEKTFFIIPSLKVGCNSSLYGPYLCTEENANPQPVTKTEMDSDAANLMLNVARDKEEIDKLAKEEIEFVRKFEPFLKSILARDFGNIIPNTGCSEDFMKKMFASTMASAATSITTEKVTTQANKVLAFKYKNEKNIEEILIPSHKIVIRADWYRPLLSEKSSAPESATQLEIPSDIADYMHKAASLSDQTHKLRVSKEKSMETLRPIIRKLINDPIEYGGGGLYRFIK